MTRKLNRTCSSRDSWEEGGTSCRQAARLGWPAVGRTKLLVRCGRSSSTPDLFLFSSLPRCAEDAATVVKSLSRRVFKSGELKLLPALPPTTLNCWVSHPSSYLSPPESLILHLSGESVNHPVRRHGGPHSSTLKEKYPKEIVCASQTAL